MRGGPLNIGTCPRCGRNNWIVWSSMYICKGCHSAFDLYLDIKHVLVFSSKLDDEDFDAITS